MRPESHREQIPQKRCENCKFAHIPEYKDDILCFLGDEGGMVVSPSHLRPYWSDITLNGETVGLLDGDEYSNVWAKRVVDWTDICDQWEDVNER